MAYNLHVVESWLRQAAAGAHKAGVLELPSARPIVTLPEDVRRRVLGLVPDPPG